MSSLPGVSAIGVYLPPTRVDNYAAASRLNIDKDLLENKIGILRRAAKNADERTSDLCDYAFADLLRQMPDLAPEKINLLCVVTQKNAPWKNSKRCMTPPGCG